MSERCIYAVAGNPILHSKSPVIFRELFRRNSSDSIYTRISASSADELMEIFKGLGIAGMNVTSPFKQSLLPFMQKLGLNAGQAQSLNTVYYDKGILTGESTDSAGCMGAIAGVLQNIKGMECYVLGAGGAVKAIMPALTASGANITIFNRTLSKAKEIALQYGAKALPLDEINEHIHKADLIISTIDPDFALKHVAIRPDAVVIDALYHGSQLRAMGNEAKFKYIGGEEWLIYSILQGFRLFTGLEAQAGDCREALKSAPEFEGRDNIILTGFMGSGKSTIGKLVAELLAYDFIDLDMRIEQSEGISISEIFATKGEQTFRQMEREMLQSLSQSQRCVIACGGGIVTNSENKKLISQIGINFLLWSPIETCLARVQGNSSRPLLADAGNTDNSLKLWAERREHYCDYADIIISSDKPADEVAEHIASEYRALKR